MEEVINQNLWNFEIGSQESMNFPVWIYVGFQQRNRQDSQVFTNEFFCRLFVTSAQCIIGTGTYTDVDIFLNCYNDDFSYSQGYGQIKETFRAFTKDDILKPFLSGQDFRSSNVRANDIGYKLYIFVIRYQQIFTASQRFILEFKFD